ncbi:MAG: hypothetical protein AB1571_01465 [Nanoarchaeota archaeon]
MEKEEYSKINPFHITKAMVLEIVIELTKRMRALKEGTIEPYDIRFSNKNLSEIIGRMMEKIAAEIFTKRLGYLVNSSKSDRDPDLFFTKLNKPLEIKITSTDTAWTGGEFSQRPFDYLLVSWGSDFDEFFVCLVHLQKDDWTSRMSKRYYGPSYSIKSLFERKDKIIFIGNLVKKGNTIKLIREKINP